MGNWPGEAPLIDGKVEGDHLSFSAIGKSPWRAKGPMERSQRPAQADFHLYDPAKGDATDGALVLTCGAILGPAGRRVVVHLSESWGEFYAAMRTAKVRKAELARRLNCHLPQVERLPDLRHASRLEQLKAAFRVLGKCLSVETREAA